MAFNPDFGLNMLQRQAAERAIKNGTDLPPQMIGDGTGVSDMHPAFLAAVRQEMTGKGREEQPEIAQRQAAPEAPQNPATAALMSGAADAARVAAMAQGGAVKGYAPGGEVTGGYGKKYKYGPLSVGPFYPQNLPFGLGKLFDDNQDPNEEVDLLAAEDAARVRLRESVANRKDEEINNIKEKLMDFNISDFRKSGLRSRLSVLEQDSKADLRRNTEIPFSFKNTDLYQYFVPQSEKREIKNEQATALTEQQRLRGELQEPLKLQSIEDLKQNPPLQEFPINADAAEAAVPAAVTDRRANDAKAAAADAVQAPTTPPPAAVQPDKPDPAAEALEARKQSESDAYKERMDKLLSDDQPLSAQDKWMALARAGFASAAGSSPYALQNIGAGLSKGVESLDELRKERAINRMKQATLLQSRRSEDLNNEARNRQLDISSRVVDIQGAREKRESEADIAERPEKMALLKAQAQAQLASAAYSLSGVELRKTSGGKADNIMTRAKALMAEAEESGNPISLDEAIQRQYKDTSQLNQKDLVTLATKLIDPSDLIGKTQEQIQAILESRAQGILNINPNSQPPPSGSAPPPAGGGPNARPPLNSFGQ